jgi:hypothetical protein
MLYINRSVGQRIASALGITLEELLERMRIGALSPIKFGGRDSFIS